MFGLFRTISSPQIFSKQGYENLENFSDYKNATPFPHLIIDNVFEHRYLEEVLDEWPNYSSKSGEIHDDGTYVKKKFATTWKTPFGPRTRALFNELGSPSFLKLLEKITGMWGLMPDPYMFGGGLHATAAGGKLAIHADYNKHPVFALDRRLNLLIYLNKHWKEENGGWLELWNQDMSKCAKRVLPVFNRMVIFSTTSTSYHGQPEPVVGPEDLWRKSIALYYFSNGRADEGHPPDKSGEHTTLWKERPSESFHT